MFVLQVFSQPNLNTMLSEVEHCLDDVPGTGLPNDSVSRRNTPESNHQGHKWNALVRQQVLELEGSGYQYKPLFGSETVSQVFFIDATLKLVLTGYSFKNFVEHIAWKIQGSICHLQNKLQLLQEAVRLQTAM